MSEPSEIGYFELYAKYCFLQAKEWPQLRPVSYSDFNEYWCNPKNTGLRDEIMKAFIKCGK